MESSSAAFRVALSSSSLKSVGKGHLSSGALRLTTNHLYNGFNPMGDIISVDPVIELKGT